VNLTEFARAGYYSQVAEVAKAVNQRGGIPDVARQKVRLPQDHAEDNLNTGVRDVLSGADTATFNYPGRRAREADRNVDWLDARNDEDDLNQVRSLLLYSSETKRKAPDARVLGGFAVAVDGCRADSLVALGAGSQRAMDAPV
jgi:hypothetical protein